MKIEVFEDTDWIKTAQYEMKKGDFFFTNHNHTLPSLKIN